MQANCISILCVDDDEVSLDHLKGEMSRVRGAFDICYCQSPQAALLTHRENPADIVISDLRMGAMTGIDMIAEMMRHRRDAIYILLSGQADLKAALSAINELKVFRFLEKPAGCDQLQLTLDSAVTELNLRKLRALSTACHSALSKLQNGVLFLDERLCVTYSNEEARRIIRTSGVFELGHDNTLRSHSPAEAREFHEFLRALAAGSDDRSIFRFERPDSSMPITASAVFHPPSDGAGAYYSIMIADPAAMRTTVGSVVAALNILPSEAKVVCGIVDGASLEEAASAAGVSLHTARSYLKSVFQKTGVTRQAELVRLALLSAA